MLKSLMKNKKQLGYLAILAAAFIYSFSGIFVRSASEIFGTFTQLTLRGLIALVYIVVWMVIKKIPFNIPKEVNKKWLLAYTITAPFSVACATLSMNMIKASNTIFYIYAGLLTSSLIFGRIWYQEKITFAKMSILLLSLIGIFIMAYPLQQVSVIGAILGITPGVLDSLENAMAKYLGKFEKTSLLVLQNIPKIVLGLPLLLLLKEPISGIVTPFSIFSLFALGIGMVLISSFYLFGFQHVDLNMGNIVSSSELIILLFLNAMFLKEYPNFNEAIGGMLILISVVSINFVSTHDSQK